MNWRFIAPELAIIDKLILSRLFISGLMLLLTTYIEKMCKEERLFMEFFNGQNYRSIQAASKSLFWTTLVCNEGF